MYQRYLQCCGSTSFFFTPEVTGSFHKSPRDRKPYQLSRTLCNILVNLNSSEFWSYDSPTDFQFLGFFPRFFRFCSKGSNYDWYYCHFHVPQVFLTLWQGPDIFLFFFAGGSLSFTLTLWSSGTKKFTYKQILFFLFTKTKSDFQAWIGWSICGLSDPFVSQNPREICASHFLEYFLACPCNVCLYGQILIICTILSWLPSLPNRVCTCHPSMPVCYICS